MTQHPPGDPGEVRDFSDAQHVDPDLTPSHSVKVKGQGGRVATAT
jgi:hypothetical protein